MESLIITLSMEPLISICLSRIFILGKFEILKMKILSVFKNQLTLDWAWAFKNQNCNEQC